MTVKPVLNWAYIIIIIMMMLMMMMVMMIIIIIIIDNFCIALFSGEPKLTALYNILQHFLSFTNIIHIIMTTNNV